MAKNSDPNNQNPDYAVEGADPTVEAKIDALMKVDVSKKVKINIGDSADSQEIEKASKSGAPLLPDDKLPDFDTAETPEHIQESKTNVEPENPAEDSTDDQEEAIEPVDTPEETLPTTEADEPLETVTNDEEVSIAEEPLAEPIETEEPTIQQPEVILSDEIGVEDRATDAAVDEIVAEESDRILAVEDAKAELTKDGVNLNKKSPLAKLKSKLKDFWANPVARRTTIAVTLLAVVLVFVVPTSRYFALNLAGVRASSSLRVVDEKTGQPLKNAVVSLSGQSGTTDKDGQVSLQKVKLGKQSLTVQKPAFADLEQVFTIGWGSNPIDDLKLTAVGSRYVFSVKDFLSDQPVDAEAVSDKYSARANEKGEIILVVEDEKIEKIDIEIIAEDYRIEKLTLPVGSKDPQNLQLVPARKHAFVSKRDGVYDLYKIDADGKNEELVIKGTGKESEDRMVILPHKTKNIVGFVSTRGEKYNKDGFALSSLNIVDLDTNKSTEISESERIQMVDFIGDSLVYVAIKSGESAASPNRHQLASYDINGGDRKELASTNYFNDVLSARGIIYYSPAEYKVNGPVGFYKIKPDGSGKETIFGKEVWNLFRVSYYNINAAVGQDWYGYDIGSSQFDKLSGGPPVLKSRVYTDAPDSVNSLWVDERDGKGVLLLYNTETNQEDKPLQTQSGLRNPIYWLDNDHIVYRVSDNSETADYVLSISGGEPKKIVDVTNIAGLDRWYYY